jgi:hypothetical protein
MPNFDFLYRRQNGSLVLKLTAICADERRAKVLAHAMKIADSCQFEVWDGDTLIYERPEAVHLRHPQLRLTA